MLNKLEITEKDIFDYVLYQNLLSAEKKAFIDENRDKFAEAIDFCSEFAKDKHAKLYVLFPINVEPKQNDNDKVLTLAASSTELWKKVESKTFVDEKSEYLVRFVSSDIENTLYFFAKRKNFKKAKLTVFPSQKSYLIDAPESSIKIEGTSEIEKISVEDLTYS